MNTIIDYMYRDASNWKQFPGADVVVAGTLTEAEQERLWASLDGEHFVAGQVGLDALQGQVTPGIDDHGFCELVELRETDASPTLDVTAQELLARFEAANAAGWDPIAECERLGIPL